jgi:dienelactone hydrolase
MAEIVFFHHAMGLTPGCRALADELTAADHVVHVPDLYGGRTFDTIDDGVAHADEVGFDTLLARAGDAVAGLPERLVYLGVSLGVLPAQHLAQTRPGAAGAVLLEACVAATEFADGWPPGLPVQVHGMDGDPFFAGEGDLDAARALVAQASATTRAELFTYPGDVHLFVDRSRPGYDPRATALVLERVIDFLRAIDDR